MKKYVLGLAVVAVFCALAPSRARAETVGAYWTNGCTEMITETVTTDISTGTRYRVLYKCCGSTCWQRTDWMTEYGPLSLCAGTPFTPPESGSWYPLPQDGNGNTLVAVPPGKGGVIGMSSSGCFPFTASGGDVIVISAGI